MTNFSELLNKKINTALDYYQKNQSLNKLQTLRKYL